MKGITVVICLNRGYLTPAIFTSVFTWPVRDFVGQGKNSALKAGFVFCCGLHYIGESAASCVYGNLFLSN